MKLKENTTEVLDDVVSYASRYGNEALGCALADMIKKGEIKLTSVQTTSLWEYGGNTNIPETETPNEGKKKFTFRFHTHGWTDITVEARDEEEAAELASDKYNEGDYVDTDSDFENTDMENVTEYYVKNNIPQ